MNPIWLDVIGASTLMLMLTFVGIWIWAWNGRHLATFARLARVPMADGPGDHPRAEEPRP